MGRMATPDWAKPVTKRDEDFLAAANKAVDEAVAVLRRERATQPGMSDAEFLRRLGAQFARSANRREIALTAAVAMWRLSQMPPETGPCATETA